MTVKLLTDQLLEFLASKEAAQARLSLHLFKCNIVGNLMSRLTLYTLTHISRLFIIEKTHVSYYKVRKGAKIRN